MTIRLNVFGLPVIVGPDKVLLKAHGGARHHLSVFFKPRRWGRTEALTPHITDERRQRAPLFLPMPVKAVDEFFREFEREMGARWLAASTPASLEELEGQGWLLIQIPDRALKALAEEFYRGGVYRLNEEAVARVNAVAVEHIVELSELNDDGRLKTILRVTGEQSVEFRHLFTYGEGQWLTVPHDWLPDDAIFTFMKKRLPRSFWVGLRLLMRTLKIGDPDKADRILAEHGC
jgi:hypothetical protein